MFAGEALKAVAHMQDDQGRPARSLDVAEYWDCSTADATNALYRCHRAGMLLRRRAWVGISRYEYILTERGRREMQRWEAEREDFEFPTADAAGDGGRRSGGLGPDGESRVARDDEHTEES